MDRSPTRQRSPRRRWTTLTIVVLGLWIAAAPFSRPLPGGAPISRSLPDGTPVSFHSTPEVGCRTPLVGAFVGDAPSADAYTSPRPAIGDPMSPTIVDCGSRARFRLVLGSTLLVVAVGLMVVDRRRGG